MKKILMTTAAIFVLATPAFAAEYYVSQDAATKKCTVSETKPDGTAQMQRGEKAYATADEANTALAADTECVK